MAPHELGNVSSGENVGIDDAYSGSMSATQYWADRKAREASRKARGFANKTAKFNVSAYCFCADTSLAALVCAKCGKKPYTD